MPRFEANVEQVKNITIVRLKGELDANTAVSADDVLQSVITSGGKAIIVDYTNLQYVSSAGLGVVLAALHACNHHTVKLIFFGLQPKIKNVFSILGLEKIISIAATEDEAMEMANRPPNS